MQCPCKSVSCSLVTHCLAAITTSHYVSSALHMQDLETEVLMHILEQQKQSSAPAALQRVPQGHQASAE